jgi:hypothetical protein
VLCDYTVKAILPAPFEPSQFTSVDVIRAQAPGNSHFFAAYQKVVLGQEDINMALRIEGEKLDLKLADLFK